MRPGVNVTVIKSSPANSYPSDTGRAFVVGLAERGPTTPRLVKSMAEFERVYGGRVSYGWLWDFADIWFKLGGRDFYACRVVGPAAVFDKVSFNDAGAAAAIRVEGVGAGDTNYKAQIVAGGAANTYVIVVTDLINGVDTEIERSPDLTDNDEAVMWASQSDYIRVVKLGANDPAVAASTALTTGNDDRAAITDVHRTAALALFTRALGPGQVLIPGSTTSTIHTALLTHAKDNNRFALLDSVDSPTRATLIAQITTQRTAVPSAVSYGQMIGPWAVVPGPVPNTSRTVPYSILQAALVSKNDGRFGNPNIPTAGSEGEATYVTSLTQTYTDADHEALNLAGFTVVKMVYGAARTYGYRTLVDADGDTYDGFLEASAARTRMAILNDLLGYGEQFMFDQIDGHGVKISEWDGGIRGILDRYWALGALFGDSGAEAYEVDTGAAVNTPATIEDLELNAAIGIKVSPFAEKVNISLARVPVSQAL